MTLRKRDSLELVLSGEVQSLLDDFASLLDIRVTFFSLDGEPVRRGKAMCNSAFCTLVQQDDEGLARCLRMDAEMRAEAERSDGVISYRCHAGIQEGLAAVRMRGRTIGYLMIGQFRVSEEPPAELVKFPPERRAELEKAFFALPLYSPEKLAGILGLFRTLIDYIAVRELAVLRGDVLRIEIERYLDRHLTENVMLPEMARRLGRSVSTISQFLRRNYHTGFKELLNEKRLKRAESYWIAHPDATVADAALAAGFSDQFYFSRVFRKRRGVSPAHFRAVLRRTACDAKNPEKESPAPLPRA